jgi:hypothetical protein
MTRLQVLLLVFSGPTYLFLIVVGSGLGYLVNRRQCSRAALWVWILPTIWSAYDATRDFSSGIHRRESVFGYIVPDNNDEDYRKHHGALGDV